MRSLVIVPTYNERENLPLLVEEVLRTDPELEMLVVDDNSPDGTGTLADVLAQETGRLHVLHRPGKQGLGSAYVAGFRFALGRDFDRIVQMDADFSHRPRDLRILLRLCGPKEVVIGSRNVPGGQVQNWSVVRKIVSRGGSFYTRLLLGLPVHDCTGGFKCFSREVIASLNLDEIRSNGYGFQIEVNHLCHRAGFRLKEVPITFPDRTLGRSKMSPAIFLEAMGLVWRLRRKSTTNLLLSGPPPAAVAKPEAQPVGVADCES